MRTADELRKGTLAFEQKHNSRYRYSKLNGKTPLEALAQSGKRRGSEWGSSLVPCNFETKLIKSIHGKTVKNFFSPVPGIF
jgi:hypothetical protein